MSTCPSPAAVRADRLAAIWRRRRPAVMGIVNCTPDSFSDGGPYLAADAAVAYGDVLVAAGADLLDVGGESTRPGAKDVPAEVEIARVQPVIAAFRSRHPELMISVDTSKADVAGAALAAGADLVNDVTAASDPAMLPTVAAAGAAVVLMHMRGNPRTMQRDTHYRDVVAEVHGELAGRAADALAAGISPERIWLDPGIGFGKDLDGNLALLAALPDLAALGHPVVVGPSRKSFIGRITGAPITERIPGTLAALLPSLGLERAVVRVHDVAAVVQFLAVAQRLLESGR